MRRLFFIAFLIAGTLQAEPNDFWVQIFAGSDKENINNIVEKYKSYNLKLYGVDGVTKILAGPYSSRKKAESVRDEFKDKGMSGAYIWSIARIPTFEPSENDN